MWPIEGPRWKPGYRSRRVAVVNPMKVTVELVVLPLLENSWLTLPTSGQGIAQIPIVNAKCAITLGANSYL